MCRQSQQPTRRLAVAVRTATAPLALVDAVRRTIHDLDRNLPISDVFTMTGSWSGDVAAAPVLLDFRILQRGGTRSGRRRRVQRRVVLSGAANAEIGIRAALGAARGQIGAMVLRQGMRAVVVGIGIGLAVALAVTRVMVRSCTA